MRKALLLLLLCIPLTVGAGTKGLKIVVHDQSGKSIALYGDSHALLIGVSEYQATDWTDLESIPSELATVEKALIEQGFTVEKHLNPNGKAEVEQTSMAVLVGVNHENRVYQAGDPLVIYLRPSKDLYARVYYVQSDGSICQILPYGSSTGFLRGGRTYAIGDVGDDIEMTITDSTLGQETIKVFASLGQIDDSHLPHGFRAGQQLNCDVTDYKELKERITRGLRLKYTVRPVAEVKILVTKRRE